MTAPDKIPLESALEAIKASRADSLGAVPRISWEEFATGFQWNQGEHVGLIGPTGSGKTNLAFFLLPFRRFVIVFGTKPRDPSLDLFGKQHGYKKLDKWERRSIHRFPRRMIWPNARRLDAETIQKDVFIEAMQEIYVQGGWTLYIDELWYIGKVLGLTHQVKVYLQQARSMDISLVFSSQRPAWIPVECYDQSTHLFFWRDNDANNLKRISGIGWLDANLIRDTVARLGKYEFLYVNTRNGEMAVSKPPAPGK